MVGEKPRHIEMGDYRGESSINDNSGDDDGESSGSGRISTISRKMGDGREDLGIR